MRKSSLVVGSSTKKTLTTKINPWVIHNINWCVGDSFEMNTILLLLTLSIGLSSWPKVRFHNLHWGVIVKNMLPIGWLLGDSPLSKTTILIQGFVSGGSLAKIVEQRAIKNMSRIFIIDKFCKKCTCKLRDFKIVKHVYM